MHHANVAAFAELQVCDFKHWRSFGWRRPGTWQLNGYLLGIGI
jgi:hypothetical protein